MWGSRYFTARYWTARFFTATGGVAPVIVSNVVKTIGEFSSPMAIGQMKVPNMNGIIKASKITGKLR